MLRKVSVLLLGVLVCGCATNQQTPIVITATPLSETSTPYIIVVTATDDTYQATEVSEVTTVPTPSPRSRWQPIAIGYIEAAFRNYGYNRYPLTGDEGELGFFWALESNYERAITWEDGRIILQVLHDKSPDVRAQQIEEIFWRLDTVLPGGFMAQLRSEYDDYNRSIGVSVSGEPEKTYTYGFEWKEVQGTGSSRLLGCPPKANRYGR
jgi:hypothetical protein